MKLSAVAVLACTAATVLLQQTQGVQGVTAIDVQVNVRSTARGWQAPVIDKTLGKSPVEKREPASFEKKRTQRSSHAKEPVKRSRKHDESLQTEPQSAEDRNSSRQRVRVSYQYDDEEPTGVAQTHHKQPNSAKATADSKASQSTPELQQQPNDANKQDDGIGDLFEAESGGMVTHQYYNTTQVQEQARFVSAAVKTQMAESAALRDDSPTSVVASMAVAGLVVCVVGVIVAAVALLRQYSEFAEMELESDLPAVEGGRVQPASSNRAEVAMAVLSSAEAAAVVEATDQSSYLPSDVEEEEETKEDDDDRHVC